VTCAEQAGLFPTLATAAQRVAAKLTAHGLPWHAAEQVLFNEQFRYQEHLLAKGWLLNIIGGWDSQARQHTIVGFDLDVLDQGLEEDLLALVPPDAMTLAM
jgi:hypothetical protein